MKKVLIVEDDPLVAELERDYLEANGYETTICYDGKKGMELSLEKEYDLLILDVMLPGETGFNICREVRKIKNVPVIMVTAKEDDIDKIRGLGLGADDYITKPFSPSELVARVKAHIYIHERLIGSINDVTKNTDNNDVIHKKDLKILISQRRVFVRDKEISLKNREFELLVFLAKNPGIVFSKESLFEKVWGIDATGDIATVFVHVGRIRDKIENDPKNPQYIETVWGSGYRFIA